METVSGIPVIDFSAMSVEHEAIPLPSDDRVQTIVRQIHEAFSTVGFVYLKNHGITQERVEKTFAVMDKFFTLNKDLKNKYRKKGELDANGWEALEREITDPTKPGDLKESFDIGAFDNKKFRWPTEVPDLQPTTKTLFDLLSLVGDRVLSVMALGLGLPADTFKKYYKDVGTEAGTALLRFNYYPRITDIGQIKPGQIRCGEHTDYGGITLLFQDDAGGLEVVNRDKKFVSATPLPGTIIVNIADLMQRWTADKFVSTVHRVIIPNGELKQKTPRRSIAFFYDPDWKARIACLDGSNKYPSIKCGKYVTQVMSGSFSF